MSCFKETKKLNDGNQFPVFGVGTFQISDRNTIMNIVREALQLGIRAFDTAAVYRNEVYLGEAFETFLPMFNLKRSDIHITSKLSPAHHGGDKVTEAAVVQSISNLKCEYLDMYLIHWPGVSGIRVDDQKIPKIRSATWAKLVELKNLGLLRSIGVSNYTKKHLLELKSYSDVLPAVNQIEFHPHYQPWDDIETCRQLGVQVQAYSSFGGSGNPSLLQNQTIVDVANRIGKTPARVLLKWTLQQNITVIPKTVNAIYMKQNTELDFNLSESDMKLISSLSKQKKYAWNPDSVV